MTECGHMNMEINKNARKINGYSCPPQNNYYFRGSEPQARSIEAFHLMPFFVHVKIHGVKKCKVEKTARHADTIHLLSVYAQCCLSIEIFSKSNQNPNTNCFIHNSIFVLFIEIVDAIEHLLGKVTNSNTSII